MSVQKVSSSKSLSEIDTLKFIAIILITNSHISHLYPNPNLGTGGSLGNTIFFTVSAIGLTLSLLAKKVPFGSWFYKRFTRTYYLPWFVIIFFALVGYSTIKFDMIELFKLFVFPTGFWFVSAITLFYIPLYFLINNYTPKNFTLLSIAVLVLYFVFYLTVLDINVWSIESKSYFKWIFYFQVMVTGVYIGNNYSKIKYQGYWDFLVLSTLTMFYFGFKFLTTKVPQLMPFQFVLHIVTIPWVIYLLKCTKSEFVYKLLENNRWINNLVITISGITLEIYLLQTFFYNLSYVKNLIFPLNIVLFAILTVIAAVILQKVFNYFKKLIDGVYENLTSN